MLFPIIPPQYMSIPFDSISLLHQIIICTSLFILDCPFLLSTFHFILPIPFLFQCLVPHPTSRYLSPFSTIFSYIASYPSHHHMLSLSPFSLSAFHFIPIGCTTIYLPWVLTHPLIHPSSHWLAIILLLFLHSSSRSSRSYWSIARLSLLY